MNKGTRAAIIDFLIYCICFVFNFLLFVVDTKPSNDVQMTIIVACNLGLLIIIIPTLHMSGILEVIRGPI